MLTTVLLLHSNPNITFLSCRRICTTFLFQSRGFSFVRTDNFCVTTPSQLIASKLTTCKLHFDIPCCRGELSVSEVPFSTIRGSICILRGTKSSYNMRATCPKWGFVALVLNWLTSGDRSVGIVRSRTQATDFVFVYLFLDMKRN
jgi:hypothetical protein